MSSETAIAKANNVTAVIAPIEAKLRQRRPISKADYDQLVAIWSAAPSNKKVTSLLASASVLREDWPVLIALLEATPENKRTDAERINLGKAYLKSGLFRNSRAAVKPLLASNSTAVSITAQAALRLGEPLEVIKLLQPKRAKLVTHKSVSDLNILASAYLDLGQQENAVSTANSVQIIKPGDIPSAQLLGRLYAEQGDFKKADYYFELVNRGYATMNAGVKRGAELTHLSKQLQTALAAKDYPRLIQIAKPALNKADPQTTAILKQYLYLAYGGLGDALNAQRYSK